MPSGIYPRKKRTSPFSDKVQFTYSRMLYRCFNPNHPQFKDWGGRGITVCPRWLGKNGFANFFKDMGEPPPHYSLERKENNDGYNPDNCKWATQYEQAQNRRPSPRQKVRFIDIEATREIAVIASLQHPDINTQQIINYTQQDLQLQMDKSRITSIIGDVKRVIAVAKELGFINANG